MLFAGSALLLLGSIVLLVAHVRLLILAFQSSILWGLLFLFFPLIVGILLAVNQWQRAKGAVQMYGGGLVAMGIGVALFFTSPEVLQRMHMHPPHGGTGYAFIAPGTAEPASAAAGASAPRRDALGNPDCEGIIEWVDVKGVPNYTDSVESIPERFRKSARCMSGARR